MTGFFERRRLDAELRIMGALREGNPRVWRYGYDMICQTRVRSGRFYPALRRLEEAGMVEATWEASDRKYRRRLYRLTTHSEETGDDAS